jgi:hypothetical protein
LADAVVINWADLYGVPGCITAHCVAKRCTQAAHGVGFEYQSDFARRYVAQGRLELTLELLALRFGPLPDAAQTRVRSAQGAELAAVVERMLTAHTLEEALGPLY